MNRHFGELVAIVLLGAACSSSGTAGTVTDVDASGTVSSAASLDNTVSTATTVAAGNDGDVADDVCVGGCGNGVTDSDPLAGLGASFTLKLLQSTGENPFAALIYECDECSFAQFAAVEPPPGWSKGPTQVILPIGELRSTPSFDGVPNSLDFIAEIPGNEFKLLGKNLDAKILEIGENGLMVRAQVMRDTGFLFPAGSRVHELTDPDGGVFVLFGYEVESAEFVGPDFQDADALVGHPRPQGWTYSTRILDEPLVMDPGGVASVLSIQGEVASTWELR